MSSSSAAAPPAWPARCGCRSLSTSTTRAIPTRSSAKKIFTCSRRRARSASTASPARCSIPAPCANCFRDSRRKRRSTPKSRKKRFTSSPQNGKFKFPITPPPLRDHGNYVISLNRFVKWLGGKVEETGHHDFHRVCRIGTALIERRSRHRRPHRRQRRGQTEPAKIKFRTRLRPASQGRDPRRGHARIADQAAHRSLRSGSRPQPANLRAGHQGTLGSPCRPHRARRSHLHHGLAADHEGIRRRLDLRRQRQRGFARLRGRARLSRPAPRSAARACRNSRNIRSSPSFSKAAR